MAANIAQPLKLKRLVALLDNLINKAGRFFKSYSFDDLSLDFESVPVIVGYLRDIGLGADAERIQKEIDSLFMSMTDVVLLECVQAEPQSEDFFRETFGIPPLASDPESHSETQENRKMMCKGRALQLRELLTELRRLLTESQSSNDGTTDDPAFAVPNTSREQKLPGVPKVYLSSWREILDALNKDNNSNEQRRVREAHARFPGPIIMPAQGGQPKVVKADLLVWWNGLEECYRDEVAERDSLLTDRSATVENQFDLGCGDHTETVVPEIDGRVKRRRGSA